LIRCSIKVYGKVQGVGFRYYTRAKAKQYDIKGWVRNLSDGSVEADAEGKKEDMDRFISALKRGPIRSSVRDVKVEIMPTFKYYSSFLVTR
jgi:acylphosphatase